MQHEKAASILTEKDINGDFIHPDGAFIIRDNQRMPGSFSLTIK